jgi:hypothetical protein
VRARVLAVPFAVVAALAMVCRALTTSFDEYDDGIDSGAASGDDGAADHVGMPPVDGSTVDAKVDGASNDSAVTDANVYDGPGCNGDANCDCVVFVTSGIYSPAFGSVDQASVVCNQLANIAVGAPSARVRFHDFVAWLSDSQKGAAGRLVHGNGEYVLPASTVIAANWTELTSGNLLTGRRPMAASSLPLASPT